MSAGLGLKPFWRYYGGKFRAAPHYPRPLHDTIIEPFAGAAGYALRYPERDVVLVERYHVIAELWRFLISATRKDILDVPLVTHIDQLPSDLPLGARYLVGFSFNDATVSPAKQLSAGIIKLASMGRKFEGWNENKRERIANQVYRIKHWKIIEGNFSEAPDVRATWFIDPPYQNAGKFYKHKTVDYVELASWCRSRSGQVIVCENEGATWLPFQSFVRLKTSFNRQGSREALWCNL